MNTEFFKNIKSANDGSFTADLDVDYMKQNYPWFYKALLSEIESDFADFNDRNDLELLQDKVSIEFTTGTLLAFYYYRELENCESDKVEIIIGSVDGLDEFTDKNEPLWELYFFLLEQAGIKSIYGG